MTNSEALEILRKELACRERIDDGCFWVGECVGCEYDNENPESVTDALKTGIEALELCVMIEDDGR